MNGFTANRLTYYEKWSQVNQTLNEHKIAKLALQETHLDQERANSLQQAFGKKMDIHFSADENTPRATAGPS